MARQRRGGGGDLVKGTLGTLIRSTLQQAGVVRDAIGSRLDEMRDGRRRTDLLAELGEVVLGLIREGEIDLEELPEARELVEAIEAMDEEGADVPPPRSLRRRSGDRRGPSGPPPYSDDLHDPDRDVALPPSRARFDERSAPSSSARARSPSGDGTVSSSTWSPPSRRAPQPTRVWRPPSDSSPPPHHHGAEDDSSPPPSPSPSDALPPARRGGISFDEEDESDLAEYMHPDDVPPKKA